MSRYKVTGKNARHEVVIGFDPPLQSCFAQVWDKAGRPDQPLLWVGCTLQALPTPDDLLPFLQPFADIPSDVLAQIQQDIRCSVQSSPSPFLEALQATFRNKLNPSRPDKPHRANKPLATKDRTMP